MSHSILRNMPHFEVISFDAEGTLVTHRFSELVWNHGIPELWARKNGASLEEAKAYVLGQYDEVSDRRLEWYDLDYWFRRFDLNQPDAVLHHYRREVALYDEVARVLASLKGCGRLVVCSGSAHQFLDIQLRDIRHHFEAVFSSVSDYGELKTTHFYQEVCRRLGVNPQQVVHVGDSRDFDYEIPREVGITAFLLDRRHGGNGDVVGDLSEFVDRLRQLNHLAKSIDRQGGM